MNKGERLLKTCIREPAFIEYVGNNASFKCTQSSLPATLSKIMSLGLASGRKRHQSSYVGLRFSHEIARFTWYWDWKRCGLTRPKPYLLRLFLSLIRSL